VVYGSSNSFIRYNGIIHDILPLKCSNFVNFIDRRGNGKNGNLSTFLVHNRTSLRRGTFPLLDRLSHHNVASSNRLSNISQWMFYLRASGGLHTSLWIKRHPLLRLIICTCQCYGYNIKTTYRISKKRFHYDWLRVFKVPEPVCMIFGTHQCR